MIKPLEVGDTVEATTSTNGFLMIPLLVTDKNVDEWNNIIQGAYAKGLKDAFNIVRKGGLESKPLNLQTTTNKMG